VADEPDVPEELLRAVCARHGIRASDDFLVLNALRNKGAPAACCGSDCRPCVLEVEAAEEELRATLKLKSPSSAGS
jgi:hypothetical protein